MNPSQDGSQFGMNKNGNLLNDSEDFNEIQNLKDNENDIRDEETKSHSMTTEDIKKELDRFIIGQEDAKKAIAVSMRNRWRWKQLPENIRKEIIPKNILMVGPTGVGKTEIARRVAKLTLSPFVKVEATKYTEVGFKGEDVDSIIKQLVSVGVAMEKEKHSNRVKKKVQAIIENKILDLILGPETEDNESKLQREGFKSLLNDKQLEEIFVEYEEDVPVKLNLPSNDAGNAWREFLTNTVLLKKTIFKFSPVKTLRTMVERQENQKSMQNSGDELIKRAIKNVEEEGIVFIDEIDKICGGHHYQADASDEGVQRDLLPIIEGTKVKTEHGEIDTSKILFITAGAFLQNKPSDLLAELLGRLPIRVKLGALSRDDLYKILKEPEIDLITQNKEMMRTENVDLRFTEESLQTIADMAHQINEKVENIGARRLFTVLEKVMEEYSFNAQKYKGTTVIIDSEYVQNTLQTLLQTTERTHYIL